MSGAKTTPEIVLEVTAIVLAVGIQVVGELYLTDADFRYRVDTSMRRVRHWFRRKRWEARYATMPGWQREAVEQVHGPQ